MEGEIKRRCKKDFSRKPFLDIEVTSEYVECCEWKQDQQQKKESVTSGSRRRRGYAESHFQSGGRSAGD